jgi:hypothetical protein
MSLPPKGQKAAEADEHKCGAGSSIACVTFIQEETLRLCVYYSGGPSVRVEWILIGA